MATCGPSSEAKANEAAQASFYQQMTQQQTQIFGAQQDLLKQIQAVSAPILARGPQQYGFTPQQEAILEGTIQDTGAKATSDTINATELVERQKTGGTNLMPSGASTQIEEDARIRGAQDTASRLSNLKLTGYDRGNQLYQQALGALSGVVSAENPTSYATAATGSGESSTGAIKLTDSENSNILQSILGGVTQGAFSLGTGYLGKIGGFQPTPMGGGH